MVTHSSDGNISYKDQLYMKITQIIPISLMLPLQCKRLHDSTIFCKILKEKCTTNFSWLTQTPKLDKSTSLVVNGQYVGDGNSVEPLDVNFSPCF